MDDKLLHTQGSSDNKAPQHQSFDPALTVPCKVTLAVAVIGTTKEVYVTPALSENTFRAFRHSVRNRQRKQSLRPSGRGDSHLKRVSYFNGALCENAQCEDTGNSPQ